ncbi:hypothetical protein VI03_18100 [Burkholderia vietnamiensis]|nr:hypothetical protein VI03_18100 [Burkholderia vietnamiensis]
MDAARLHSKPVQKRRSECYTNRKHQARIRLAVLADLFVPLFERTLLAKRLTCRSLRVKRHCFRPLTENTIGPHVVHAIPTHTSNEFMRFPGLCMSQVVVKFDPVVDKHTKVVKGLPKKPGVRQRRSPHDERLQLTVRLMQAQFEAPSATFLITKLSEYLNKRRHLDRHPLILLRLPNSHTVIVHCIALPRFPGHRFIVLNRNDLLHLRIPPERHRHVDQRVLHPLCNDVLSEATLSDICNVPPFQLISLLLIHPALRLAQAAQNPFGVDDLDLGGRACRTNQLDHLVLIFQASLVVIRPDHDRTPCKWRPIGLCRSFRAARRRHNHHLPQPTQSESSLFALDDEHRQDLITVDQIPQAEQRTQAGRHTTSPVRRAILPTLDLQRAEGFLSVSRTQAQLHKAQAALRIDVVVTILEDRTTRHELASIKLRAPIRNRGHELVASRLMSCRRTTHRNVIRIRRRLDLSLPELVQQTLGGYRHAAAPDVRSEGDQITAFGFVVIAGEISEEASLRVDRERAKAMVITTRVIGHELPASMLAFEVKDIDNLVEVPKRNGGDLLEGHRRDGSG